MKKSVKILALILAIALTAVCFAACGKQGDNQDPAPVDPTPVDPTPVDPTPVDPTPVEPEHALGLNATDAGKAWAIAHADAKCDLRSTEVSVIVTRLKDVNTTAATSTEEYTLAIQIGDVVIFVNHETGNAMANGKVFSLDEATLAYIKSVADSHLIPYAEPEPSTDPVSGDASSSEVPANPERPATDKQIG